MQQVAQAIGACVGTRGITREGIYYTVMHMTACIHATACMSVAIYNGYEINNFVEGHV